MKIGHVLVPTATNNILAGNTKSNLPSYGLIEPHF